MKRNIALVALALLAMTCSVLEGLVDTLPPQFVQINGLLIIVCTGVYLAWNLKYQRRGSS